MKLKIEGIFLPSVGVDMVFDMNTCNPTSRSTIIYDTDFEKNRIIVAQPLRPITEKSDVDQLHLTTIIYHGKRKIRAGIQCQPVEYDDHYLLANQTVSKALILKYTSEVSETNIRSAFRLPLSQRFTIKSKILYNKTDFYTAQDFTIRDISFTGLGVAIPLKKAESDNPLLGLKKKDIIPLGLILMDRQQEKPIGTFPLKTMVARVDNTYSASHVLVGLKILEIKRKNEDLLDRFIHNAQVDELKRLSIRRD